MANYTKATNFTAKDGLPANNSGKIVKGAEIDTEFNAIAAAITSKADSNSPTLTGTPLAPTASSSTNNTQIATTAFVATAISNINLGTISSQDSDDVSITGGSITGIADLAIADGGTGASTAAGARTNLGLGALATASGYIPSIQTFTSSGNFTVPSGVTKIKVTAVGGGGGGAGTTNTTCQGGGGAGGLIKVLTVTPADTISFTVGAGGSIGSAGTSTTFTYSSTTYTANGGGAGVDSGTSVSNGGTATNGDINVIGQHGGSREPVANYSRGGDGGNSPFGLGFGGRSGQEGSIISLSPTGYGGGGAGRGFTAVATAGSGGIVIIEY